MNEKAKEISLLIFDLDGTLADTIYSIRDAVNIALGKAGFPERNYEDVRMAIGNGARKLIERCLPEDKRDAETLARVYRDYEAAYDTTYLLADRCYDGLYEVILALKERGYTIAVLSNKQDFYVKGIVNALFPEGVISFVQGQTELPTKPDPTVPLMICRELGFSASETAFIGDSDVDIVTGKNAGMYSVGVSWGYRPREVLAERGADAIADAPAELLGIFA